MCPTLPGRSLCTVDDVKVLNNLLDLVGNLSAIENAGRQVLCVWRPSNSIGSAVVDALTHVYSEGEYECPYRQTESFPYP